LETYTLSVVLIYVWQRRKTYIFYKYRSEIRRLRKDSVLDIYDGCVPKFTASA